MLNNSSDQKKSSSSEAGEVELEFKPVSCLLTVEELDQKCDEQFSVIWNGPNSPPP